MNDLTVRRAKGTILLAIALCVVNLGTVWYRIVDPGEGVFTVSGYRLESRLFLAAAIVCLAFALHQRAGEPRTAARAVNVSIVILLVMVGLGLRRYAGDRVFTMTPTALVLSVGTIVLLLSVRVAPRRP